VKHKGKLTRRVKAFDSVEAAKEAFPVFRADVKGGRNEDRHDGESVSHHVSVYAVEGPEAVTLDAFVKQHWNGLHLDCEPSTVATNEKDYRLRVRPTLGGCTLTEAADIATLQDLTALLHSTGLSPYTVNRALRFVRKVLHFARLRKDANGVRLLEEVPSFKSCS
jgi:hypothetical protein